MLFVANDGVKNSLEVRQGKVNMDVYSALS